MEPPTSGSAATWDGAKVYRITSVPTAGGFDLWYSAYGTDGDAGETIQHRTGRTALTLL